MVSNQRAIDISQQLDDHPGLARDLSNRGYILSVMGELDPSLDFYFRGAGHCPDVERPDVHG